MQPVSRTPVGSDHDDLIPRGKGLQVCPPASHTVKWSEQKNKRAGHGQASVTRGGGGGALGPQFACSGRGREDDGGSGEDCLPWDGDLLEYREGLLEEERAADAVHHLRGHGLHAGLHAEGNSSVHTGNV